MKEIFSYLFMLILIIYLSLSVQAGDGNVIFSIEDPVEDDCGPCYYNYPTNKVFAPYRDLFDIKRFTVVDSNDNYLFKFHFTKITDPWDSNYGFSMPLIELYIDNAEGGCKDLFKEGANIKLASGHPWNKLIKLSGWWVRVFTPEDRNKDMIDLSLNTEKLSWNIENCRVEVNDNIIELELKKELIGQLSNSFIYILVGSFDPFGLDHFRGIQREKSSWSFSVEQDTNIKYAPRVIDIILPSNKKQEEVLGDFQDDYCQIYPVKVTGMTGNINIIKKNVPYIAVMVIFLVIIIMNKDNIFKHTNR